MATSTYYQGRHADVETMRIEAEKQRREHPEDATGRHSLPAPIPITGQQAKAVPTHVPPDNGNSLHPSDPFIVRSAAAFWKIAVLVLSIVVGTVSTLSWLDQRIKDSVAPMREEIAQIRKGVNRLLERQGQAPVELLGHD